MKLLATFTLILFMSTLVLAQKVKTDMDKEADFTKYKTFTFLGWQDDSDKVLNDIDKKRMRDAFKEEFQKRNMKQVEEGADMAVSLFIVAQQKTSTTAYTNYYGGAYGGYRRGGWGWGGGHSSTTYNETDYVEGTLVMDVYDEESQNLIWQGVAVGTVKDPKKREKSIPKTVSKLMKKFPIQPVK